MKSRSFKYLIGGDRDSAVAAAEEHFGQRQEELRIEVVREGNEEFPWMILASSGVRAAERLGNRNGAYGLYFEEDGVYLEIYPAQGEGLAVDRNEIAAYILRKGIAQLNRPVFAKLIEKGWGRERIAPAQEEIILNEDVTVATARNDMEATIQFLPPDEEGTVATGKTVMQALTEAGIIYGISQDAIVDALAERKYKQPYLVAEGTAPVNGEDARLEFHFSTSKDKARPKILEDSRVDYRELDLFEPVKEGQLLVSRIPATPGTPGRSVKGEALPPKPGKEVNLPKSKNVTVNEERTAMCAQKTGMVEYLPGSGTVVVADIYTIKGDCDMAVGNIDFDGSVEIKGSIISGLIVKATGSIQVGGVVEGAELIAGGNIVLKRGIQGMDKGTLTAGGSIEAMFIERARVLAGGSITADVIIHSTVEAGDSVYLTGKRASVMGGTARVTRQLVAKAVGSVAHTQTEIEVGLPPQKRVRMKFLADEMKRLQEAAEKLEKLGAYLSNAQAKLSDENRAKLVHSMQENVRLNNRLMKECSEELSNLQYEAEHVEDGKVHVLDTAYPGAKITIGRGVYRVNSPVTYATFRLRKGEVSFFPCEYTESH